jgi:cell division protein FtsN
MRRPVKRSGGAAGLFVLIGILTILAVTFAAGTYAGRIWATRPHMLAAASHVEREPARRGPDTRASRLTEPAPRLTFYQELTAPLTAPPPPPKPAKTSPPPLVTTTAPPSKAAMPERVSSRTSEVTLPETLVGRDGATNVSNRPPAAQAGLASPATTESAVTTRASTSRFTIQVAAYRQRPPADALRATLAAAGHDVRVVENDAPNGVRFRVQIGDFVSRDAARDAAARFAGSTFVTTR